MIKQFCALSAFGLLLACGASPDATEQEPTNRDVTDKVECGALMVFGDIRPALADRDDAALLQDGRVVGTYPVRGEVTDALNHCNLILPDGAVAFAGFTDSHAHLLGIGLRELTLNLEGTWSVANLQERLREVADEPQNTEVIVGRGWIETGWPERRMPNRQDLDAVIPDRPVILIRADGHASVANTAALEAAGVSEETPDPDGGRIERDADGVATGILIDTAMDLVAFLIPELSDDRRRLALEVGAQTYANMGWTTIHNMSVDPRDVVILKEMAAAGDLPLRVMNYLNPEALEDPALQGVTCTEDLFVCTMGLKLYVDGALGSRGALLAEPYYDQPDTLGLQLISEEDAKAIYEEALGRGIQITTHAIGDQGNHLVLDWYADVLADVDDHRWRIEHAQILNTDDIPRFHQQGVLASMQPSHAIGDLFFAPDRLGPDRLNGAYAWKSILNANGVVVAGSDAPVERGDPLIELHAATIRKSLDGYSDENWNRHEIMNDEETLASFTTAPAFAVFLEDQMGRLAPGYVADITVFEKDPFTTPWSENRVLFTIVAGEVRGAAEGVDLPF